MPINPNNIQWDDEPQRGNLLSKLEKNPTLVQADILANRALGGQPETISARVGREQQYSPTAKLLADGLNKIDPGHTDRAMKNSPVDNRQPDPASVQWDDGDLQDGPPGASLTPVRTRTQELVRQLGLTGRAGLTGITGLSGMLADVPFSLANVAGANLPLPSQTQQKLMTRIGLPEPQGTQENIIQALSSMVAGGGDPLSKALQMGVVSKWAAPEKTLLPEIKAKTLKELGNAGYSFPPSIADAGIGSRTLEGIGGPTKLAEMLKAKNEVLTNQLARKALKLPPDTPLDETVLKGISKAAYEEGYVPIMNIGQIATRRSYKRELAKIVKEFQGQSASFPDAAKAEVANLVKSYDVPVFDTADAVRASRQLRLDATDAFKSGNNALGLAQKGIAKALENNIEVSLQSKGKDASEILKNFHEARVTMAKVHSIEAALIPGTGSVDAMKIAAQASKGTKFTDELALIAKAGSTGFSKATAYPKGGTPPPISTSEAMFMGGAGAGSTVLPALAPLTAIPAARYGVRELVASRPFQKAFIHGTGQAPTPSIFGNPVTQRAIPSLYQLFGQEQ